MKNRTEVWWSCAPSSDETIGMNRDFSDQKNRFSEESRKTWKRHVHRRSATSDFQTICAECDASTEDSIFKPTSCRQKKYCNFWQDYMETFGTFFWFENFQNTTRKVICAHRRLQWKGKFLVGKTKNRIFLADMIAQMRTIITSEQ